MSFRCQIDGTLVNTGHDVRLVFDDGGSSASAVYVNISGGPFAYQFRAHQLSIHFGRDDTLGSEHSIKQRHFPAEVGLLTPIDVGWLGGIAVRASDLRLEIAGSIPAAVLSSATLDKLFSHIVQRL